MINRTMIANLVEVFHMTIPEIAQLTDAQIKRIYFHPRKKSGELEKVEVKKPVRRKASKKKNDPDNKNLRWAEYYESYTSLFNMKNHSIISEQDFNRDVIRLQSAYSDLFDKPVEEKKETHKEVETSYEEDYAILEGHMRIGLISQENFNDSISKLKQIHKKE